MKITTIRVVLALASIHCWPLQQLDVNNAFLHGDLSENVYMNVPPGVSTSRPNQCCKLLKSIYSLKQAIRQWYEKLSLFLISCGYQQAPFDHSLFIKTITSAFTALIVYVDDIVLIGNSPSEMATIKHTLASHFRIKDLGPLKYFLGFEVAHSNIGISLCQRKYCLDLLTDSGLLGANPSSTLMDSALRLHHDLTNLLPNAFSYRRLVGRLIYFTTTRPDISYDTQQLSQFMSNPIQAHFCAARHILKYLKRSPGCNLLFSRDSPLHGYSDSDWAGCVDTRSITGYCFHFGTSLISWKTKKQPTVSHFSSEAEYRALASTTCELQWLTYLLNDRHVVCLKSPIIFCDSQSELHIAANPIFHEHTKYLDIDCHLVCEKSQFGLMRLLPISYHNQITNIFTKALPPMTFQALLSKLGLVDIFQPSTCVGGGANDINSQAKQKTKETLPEDKRGITRRQKRERRHYLTVFFGIIYQPLIMLVQGCIVCNFCPFVELYNVYVPTFCFFNLWCIYILPLAPLRI